MIKQSDQNEHLITMTSDIVSAHVANNNVAVSDISLIIENVHGALRGLSDRSSMAPQQQPAVAIKNSVQAGHIVCLGCGAEMKMLKRHIKTSHQMTPEEYRQAWGLSPDYPMVSSNYSKKRSGLAKKIGLGRKTA